MNTSNNPLIPGSTTKRSLPLFALFFTLTLPAVVTAQFVHIIENGTVTITGYVGDAGAMVIPDMHFGWPVTRIGPRAFNGRFDLASVSIPESVTSIGERAFASCMDLASIEFGGGLTSIDNLAFLGCFRLTNVELPDSVRNVGIGAFGKCTDLAKITMGSNVSNIGNYAFAACASLRTFDVGKSVLSVGAGAFIDCTSLIALEADAESSFYSSRDGVIFDKSQTELVLCPPGQPGSYVIPEHVTRLGRGAVLGCTRLRSVVLPASVTAFGDSALGTDSLESVYFLGDAPAPVSNLFDYRAPVTVLYLPTATGWGAWYSSKRTSIWTNPAILEGSVTVDGSGFGFTIAWAPDTTVLVEVSPTPTETAWTPLSTHQLSGGVSQFRDTEPTAKPSRFYRLRAL
jgi:hypothetical protein